MTTIRNGHLHYAYEDENADILAVDRGPAGTARVSIQRGRETSVLAEHVPEVCRHLADKADAKIIVLDASWIQGDSQIVGHNVVGMNEKARTVSLLIDADSTIPADDYTGRRRELVLTPGLARNLAVALAHQADIAEQAAQDAEIAGLEQVIAATGMGRPRWTLPAEAARAVWAAGYRKQVPDAQV